MKKLSAILFVLIPLFGFSQAKEFSWLLGKWKIQNKAIYETWKVASDGKTLEGVSFRVTAKDTIVSEKMKIRKDKESFYYVPDVAENKGEVYFKIMSFNDKNFIAENPKHDFPKIIRYQLQSPVSLKAEIEGDGKVIPYYFDKMK